MGSKLYFDYATVARYNGKLTISFRNLRTFYMVYLMNRQGFLKVLSNFVKRLADYALSALKNHSNHCLNTAAFNVMNVPTHIRRYRMCTLRPRCYRFAPVIPTLWHSDNNNYTHACRNVSTITVSVSIGAS